MAHTTIRLNLDSVYNGKPIRNMELQERMALIKSIGNKHTDMVVEDGGKEICGFDSDSMMPYCFMKVKDVILGYLNGSIR